VSDDVRRSEEPRGPIAARGGLSDGVPLSPLLDGVELVPAREVDLAGELLRSSLAPDLDDGDPPLDRMGLFLRGADGVELYDDVSLVPFDDWSPAEAAVEDREVDDEPVEFEVVEVFSRVVERRAYRVEVLPEDDVSPAELVVRFDVIEPAEVRGS
jgi:hypothetical protein